MNGKNVITTTKVPLQKQNRRNRKTKTKIVYVRQPLQEQHKQGGKRYNRRKKNNRRARRKGGKSGEMSKHFAKDKELKMLAQSMMNPFDLSAKGVKLKDSSITMTDTFFVTGKGTGSCNKNGNGWIIVAPGKLSVKDVNSINYSSYANNSDDGMGGNGNLASTNSPFITTDFTNKAESKTTFNLFRPVSVGIRVRCLNNRLNMSGVAYTIQCNPRSKPLDGFLPDDIQKQGYKEYPFANDKFHSVNRHITDQLDYQFQQFVVVNEYWVPVYEGDDTESPPSLDANWNLGIFISSQPECPFEWEVYAHFERKGPSIQNASIAKPNQEGMSALTYSMSKLRMKDNTTPDHIAPSSKSSSGGVGDKILDKVLDSAFDFMF